MTADSSRGDAPAALDPSGWSVRQWGVVLAVMLVLAGGVAYVLTNEGSDDAKQTVSLDQPPRAVMDANQRLLLRTDHRRITNVSRVVDGERKPLYTFENLYDYSDGQYLANYDGSGGDVTYTHTDIFVQWPITHDTALVYVHEGWINMVRDFSDYAVGDYEVNVTSPHVNDSVSYVQYRYPDGSAAGFGRLRSADEHDRLVSRSPFVNASVSWERRGETNETVTYHIDDVSTYAKVRPMLLAHAVHDGSRIWVTLSKETGRIQSLTEHRIVTTKVETDDGDDSLQRVHMVIETRFTDYGSVDVTRPPGIVPRSNVTE